MMREELFGEPAWDMLLALYCLPARGLIITVSTLTYCTDVPETTGLRWQNVLIKEGLIVRSPDGTDQRKHLVRLSSPGRALMDAYLTRLFYKASPLPATDREAMGG
jgi:DNA-binding MarR family transcriptional regulator